MSAPYPSTIAICKTCGLPVRVIWDEDNESAEVFAVCGHVQLANDAEEESP